jgi:membrane protein insertase Oxa1/YidC/SpoIIIJ
MTNETNNETTNLTGDMVEETGILNTLTDNVEYIGLGLVVVAIACAVVWMKVPAFRLMVRKQYARFMKQHKDEMEELYNKYFTKAMQAKMDATKAAKIKAAILEKAILSEVDHRTKAAEADLKKEMRELSKNL